MIQSPTRGVTRAPPDVSLAGYPCTRDHAARPFRWPTPDGSRTPSSREGREQRTRRESLTAPLRPARSRGLATTQPAPAPPRGQAWASRLSHRSVTHQQGPSKADIRRSHPSGALVVDVHGEAQRKFRVENIHLGDGHPNAAMACRLSHIEKRGSSAAISLEARTRPPSSSGSTTAATAGPLPRPPRRRRRSGPAVLRS